MRKKSLAKTEKKNLSPTHPLTPHRSKETQKTNQQISLIRSTRSTSLQSFIKIEATARELSRHKKTKYLQTRQFK